MFNKALRFKDSGLLKSDILLRMPSEKKHTNINTHVKERSSVPSTGAAGFTRASLTCGRDSFSFTGTLEMKLQDNENLDKSDESCKDKQQQKEKVHDGNIQSLKMEEIPTKHLTSSTARH